MESLRRSRNIVQAVKGRALSLERRALRVSAGISARLRRDQRRVSVAIPTFERRDPAAACLDRLIADDRVAEIVVRDDASHEAVYAVLCERLPQRSPKLRLARNSSNVGPLANKWRTIRDCTSDWVILLDADNSFDRSYLDLLFGIRPWDHNVIYCPDFARPHFDFTRWGGETIDLARAKTMLASDSQRFATTFFNTGNFFVKREQYLRRVQVFLDSVREVPDVLVANYAWMRDGGTLRVVKGLTYDHLVRSDGFHASNRDRCQAAARVIRECIARDAALPDSLRSPQRQH
jgi:glycosyltransferase involved in cell wall biosynthesis